VSADKYHFSVQFTADLLAMNHADFIVTSTYQEIAGNVIYDIIIIIIIHSCHVDSKMNLALFHLFYVLPHLSIPGHEESVGQYESYCHFTMPHL